MSKSCGVATFRTFSNIYITECTFNKQLHFSELRSKSLR